jgi:transposase-like protein
MKNKEITCPHCGNNEHIKKNGRCGEEQAYKCDKTFRLSGKDKRIKHSSTLDLFPIFYLHTQYK